MTKPERDDPRWRPLNSKYVHLDQYTREFQCSVVFVEASGEFQAPVRSGEVPGGALGVFRGPVRYLRRIRKLECYPADNLNAGWQM